MSIASVLVWLAAVGMNLLFIVFLLWKQEPQRMVRSSGKTINADDEALVA